MNLEKLRQNLLAVARATPPSDGVPYGFEHRIMAHLALRRALDHSAFWAGALWRAAAPCVGLMLLLVAWFFFAPVSKAPSNDLSLDLENTLLTAAEQEAPPPTDFFW